MRAVAVSKHLESREAQAVQERQACRFYIVPRASLALSAKINSLGFLIILNTEMLFSTLLYDLQIQSRAVLVIVPLHSISFFLVRITWKTQGNITQGKLMWIKKMFIHINFLFFIFYFSFLPTAESNKCLIINCWLQFWILKIF